MINFVKYRGITALFSLILFVAFVGVAVYRYNTRGSVFSYSIDFTGGTQVLLKFSEPVNATHIKEIVEQSGWHGAATREFSKHEVLVRVKEYANDAIGLAERIRVAIQEKIPGSQITIEESDAVGPGVGTTLRWKSIQALFIALILLLLYIAFRFLSVAFAVGAVVALFHDAFAMLAMILFFDREISMSVIGAILAVLGYSINDTIVIFSQIRDSIKNMRGKPLSTVVNTSLNHTLRRTILTSLSTALPVLAMFFFGGEALRDFSFVLLVGILFGTYSSIYIATSIMMLLYKE